jgi:sodium transport system permease protein
MLARNPRRTLLLERLPHWSALAAAVVLAFVMHPISMRLAEAIQRIYPVTAETESSAKAIESALTQAPHWWMTVALMALLPAVCEELAFRGFILSAFRHLGHKWWAIALSAVAFGGVHLFLQQKIAAAAVGLLIGYLAVQTGSLLPCIVFHAVHNSLQVLVHRWTQNGSTEGVLGRWLGGESPLAYHWVTVAGCGLVAATILWRLHGWSYRRTAEEQLEEARRRQDSPLVGA